MKSVLQNINPYEFYLICEGKREIEVIKTEPRSKEWDGVVYLYCSKNEKSFERIPEKYREKYRKYLGTVGARVYVSGILDIYYSSLTHEYIIPVGIVFVQEELVEYGKGKNLCGLHISNLKIYDKPRELSDFKTPDKSHHKIIEHDGSLMFMDGYESGKPLKRAPQSWQYVEEVEE